MILRIFPVIVIAVILLSSCTGRRYAHYNYIKAQKKPLIALKKHSIKQPGLITPTKKSFQVTIENVTVRPQKKSNFFNPQAFVAALCKPEIIQCKNPVLEQDTAVVSTKEQKPHYHWGAFVGLGLSITELFLLRAATIFLPLAIVCIALFVASIIISIKALSDIYKYPKKYRGSAFAIAGITISLVVTVVLTFIVLIFLAWYGVI